MKSPGKYDPPYTAEQMEAHGYRKELIKRLIADKVHGWRMRSGIELIHREPDLKELNRTWANWNLMSDEQKRISDKKSMDIFGVDNRTNYSGLVGLYDRDTGKPLVEKLHRRWRISPDPRWKHDEHYEDRLSHMRKDEDKFNQLGGITRMIAFGRPGSVTDRYAREGL